MPDKTCVKDDAHAYLNLNTYQLIEWCIEIAEAMEFLAAKKVIHGDLAARNVLLTDKLQAKVSDFGLSKKLYQYYGSGYVKRKPGPLPWKWMAIESLRRMCFSSKSDVWSYGITCWEIFSLGDMPYFNFAWTQEFVKALEIGLRPGLPQFAPMDWYFIMTRCWQADPNERPDFAKILSKAKQMQSSLKGVL